MFDDFRSFSIFFMICLSFGFDIGSLGIFACPSSLFLFAFGCLVVCFLCGIEFFSHSRFLAESSLLVAFAGSAIMIEAVWVDAAFGEF